MNWNIYAIEKAVRFASLAHKGQKMPGMEKLNYDAHFSMVAMTVMSLGEDAFDNPRLALTLAVLHDVIEDVAKGESLLKSIFDEDVVSGVKALSKNPELPKKEQMPDSLRRIALHSKEACIVKMADRSVNLGPPPEHWNIEKKIEYLTEARLILKELGFASKPMALVLEERIALYEKAISNDSPTIGQRKPCP